MDDDERAVFVINNIVALSGVDRGDGDALLHTDELRSFLDDPNCYRLQAHVRGEDTKATGRVFLTTSGAHASQASQAAWAEDVASQVIFVKSGAQPLEPRNMASSLQVTSVQRSPMHSLYHLLKNVYRPLMLEDARWSEQVDPKVQDMLRKGWIRPSIRSRAHEGRQTGRLSCSDT